MIRLHMFGALSLADADGREVHGLLSQPRRVALLAYLATVTPPGLRRRDTVLGLLWPDLDQEHARAALRQTLHGLRGALGAEALLIRGDDEVGIAAERVWCDVAAFNRAIADGACEDAAELYRGELLAGFFVSGAPEYERWLDGERRRLQETASRNARALVDRREAVGDLPAAAAWARRAVQLVPLEEGAVRRLIVLLDRLGDRAGAVQAYEDFATRLKDDLEVEPAPETMALIAAVRSRDIARAPVSLLAAPPHGADGGAIPAPAAGTLRRSPRWDRASGALIGLVASLAVGIGGIAWYARGHGEPSLHANRVVVPAFVNRTGDSALAPLGEWASDWIMRGLALTGVLEVAEPTGLVEQDDRRIRGPRPGAAASDPITLARATGSALVVRGTFYRRADQLEFEANVTDAQTGRRVATLEPITGEMRDPRPALAAMREHVMSALAQAVDRRFADPSLVSDQPPRYEAFLAFTTGANRFYPRGDYRDALPYLRRAATLDTTYALPLIWAEWIHRTRDECDSTDAIARRLAGLRLTPIERFQAEREPALCRGDLALAYELSRQLADALPGSEMAADQLARTALGVGRPGEAVAILRRLHPDSGALRGHALYYLILTAAHHARGEHRRELEAAARGRRQYPGFLGILRHDLVALAALGRVREITARLPELEALTPRPYRHPATVMRETALELMVHGHPGPGAALLRHELGWLGSRGAAEQATESARFERAQAWYAAGHFDSARATADSLVREHPDHPGYVGLQGALAAVRGDRAQAERTDSQLARRVERFGHGVPAYWRACIAAQLGNRDAAVGLLAVAHQQGLPTNPATSPMTRYVLGQHVEPCFTALHGYAPFDALLRPRG